MHKPFKFRYASQVAGTFVIITLLILLVGIFVASNQQGWFEGKFTLRTKFDTKTGAFGLREGNDVMILNTLAGNVGKIRPTEDGQVETAFIIQNRFKQFVRTDSVAKVRRKFVAAGDSYIEIEAGDGAMVSEGDYIVCVKDEEIMDTAQAVLSDVQKVVLPLVEEVQEMMEHLNAIFSDLEEGKGITGALINDPALAKDIKEVVHSSNIVMEESQKTFRESTRLIRAVQKSWLLRKYVEEDKSSDEMLSPLYMSDDAVSSLRDYSKDALELARTQNNPLSIAHSACMLGYMHLKDGKYNDAQVLLDEARSELAFIGKRISFPMLLEGELLRKKGQDEAALNLARHVMTNLGKSDMELQIQSRLMAADILCDLNRPAEARKELRDAEYYIKKAKSSAVSASSVHIMGRINDIEKDYRTAGLQYDEESKLRQQAGQYTAMTLALISSGNVYEKSGIFDQSADRYFRAGRSILYEGDLGSAQSLLQKAISSAQKAGNDYIVTQASVMLNQSRP